MDGVADLTLKFVAIVHEVDIGAKGKMAADLVENYLPFWLGAIDKKIKENNNQKFLVGNKYSIADFLLGAMIFSVFENPANDYSAILKPLLEGSENLKAWIQNFGQDLKPYFDSRPHPRPY